MQDVKAKGAMSMLTLLLFLSLATSFLLNPEAFRNMLKLLVIALIMLAGLAAASTPPINGVQKGRPPPPQINYYLHPIFACVFCGFSKRSLKIAREIYIPCS